MSARLVAFKLLNRSEHFDRNQVRASTGSMPDLHRTAKAPPDPPKSPDFHRSPSIASTSSYGGRKSGRDCLLRRCVSFDNTLYVHNVWTTEEYDRHADTPSMLLSYRERVQVLDELDKFKNEEMLVHPDSHRTSLGLYPDLVPPAKSLRKGSRGSAQFRSSQSADSADESPRRRGFIFQKRLVQSLEKAFN